MPIASISDLFPGLPWWVLLPGLVIHVVAICQCVKSHFDEPTNKIVWMMVILLTPLLGSILWFVMDQETQEQK